MKSMHMRYRLYGALLVLIIACPLFAGASPYDKYHAQYPESLYLVGVGEVERTGNRMADKRVAEVLARREIAVQIKVRVSEVSLDIMCSEQTPACKDMVSSVIEQTVNEFLKGSRIVDSGEREGVFFAVAVMPREGASADLLKRYEDALKGAREELDKAKAGGKDSATRAREQYLRARAYEIERQIIEGVRANASAALDDLDAEIKKLGQ